jgi:ribosomal protein S18 acetylase RimI-like enzyme
MGTVVYRDAKVEECLLLADYINKTAGGILDFLYEGLTPGSSTIELVADSLAEGKRYDSYKSITVAEYEGKAVGMVSSYPALYHGIDEEMAAFFPPERLDVLKNFFNTRIEDSFYLSSIYVDEAFRGRGIGSGLINSTKEKARESGFSKVTLLVMADNIVAKKVYDQNGFKKIKNAALSEQRLIPHRGGVDLLMCPLD